MLSVTSAVQPWCAPYLDPGACEALLHELEHLRWEPGTVLEPEGGPGEHAALRRCLQVSAAASPLGPRVARDLVTVNRALWSFELAGLHPEDPPFWVRYGPGDHFGWHLDNALARPPFGSRKLGFTLQLSDPDGYQGGDLEIAAFEGGETRRAARAQGTLIAFPAFLAHRLTPVQHGARTALVGWLHGPAFR
jgi:predicted 2-oxoglutarate/Fe(II)-dependent dioxygenase YbiX